MGLKDYFGQTLEAVVLVGVSRNTDSVAGKLSASDVNCMHCTLELLLLLLFCEIDELP